MDARHLKDCSKVTRRQKMGIVRRQKNNFRAKMIIGDLKERLHCSRENWGVLSHLLPPLWLPPLWLPPPCNIRGGMLVQVLRVKGYYDNTGFNLHDTQ